MALPLKSGADLYNNQALRLRLHNLGADPTEVGAGLIYFNTSTGLNTSQKARLYTGSAWKTIAFSEDLDVASNADFLALKDRVDLLSGDVDTDAIINNMKEVSAFLEGFNEDASLMDYLNTELGKKLDISGGEMTGKLVMYNRISMGNQVIEMGKGLFGAYNDGEKLYWFTPSNETWNEILTSAGGTITSSSHIPLIVESTASNGYVSMRLKNASTHRALGIKPDGTLFVTNAGSWDSEYPILHSGNVGDYAVKYFGNQGGIDFNDALYNGVQYTSSSSSNNGRPSCVLLSLRHGDAAVQIVGGRSTGNLMYRGGNGTADSWSDWKAIAFTDSDITGNAATATLASKANQLCTKPSGLAFAYADEESAYMTLGRNNYAAYLDGSSVTLRYGSSLKQGLILNSSGNVTIGASDLAGTSRKLFVSGGSAFFVNTQSNITTTDQLDQTKTFTISAANDDTYNYGLHVWIDPSGRSNLQSSYAGLAANKSTYPIALNPLGGNVLIGTTTDKGQKLQVNGNAKLDGYLRANTIYLNRDSDGIEAFEFSNVAGTNGLAIKALGGNAFLSFWTNTTGGVTERMRINGSGNVGIGTSNPTEKLHVVGNLHVTGNIIADGEVSAGGAAEEGGNAGGGGAFHSESIAVGATQTTIAHGLGTDDIVVSIYEKDGVSGRWSIILTDVEIVDANNIIVSFGSATTVEHKVVIMGAVA